MFYCVLVGDTGWRAREGGLGTHVEDERAGKRWGEGYGSKIGKILREDGV